MNAGVYQDTGHSPVERVDEHLDEDGDATPADTFPAGAPLSKTALAVAPGSLSRPASGTTPADPATLSRTEQDIQRAYEAYQRRQDLKARLTDPSSAGPVRARSVPRGGQNRPVAPTAAPTTASDVAARRFSARAEKASVLPSRVEQIYGSSVRANSGAAP